MAKKEIYVYADWEGISDPEQIGTLTVDRARGKDSYGFSYTDTWLRSGHQEILDPDLQLYSGMQFRDTGTQMFGVFLGSAPDRWGRLLMQRREQILARSLGRPVQKLTDVDFFTGVSDITRMGGLRYRLEPDGPFIAEDSPFSCPPITSIRELQYHSLKFEQESDGDASVESLWLQQLIAPGSSLGGARPKSNVKETDGSLWIAKFPSHRDTSNIGGWEMVAHDLAKDVGLNIPDARIMNCDSPYHTFLVKRFDRTSDQCRIHFSSAMTLLGYSDGMDHTDGASYLDIAELIMRYGSEPDQDLQELWKRIVFSICISNSDDHLRNHGFLLTPSGWKLSPAYDVNPSPGSYGLSLAIDDLDNSMDLELVRRVAPHFRIDTHTATILIEEILHTVSFWRQYARKYRIPEMEQSLYESAFKVALPS